MANNSPPLELCFEVLSHLFPTQVQDADALRACSLLSTATQEFCQRKLFSRVVLHTGPEDGESGLCHRLLEIFTDSPHLVSYVRHIVLRDDDSWVRWDKALAAVLQTLSAAPIASFACIFNPWTHWEHNPLKTRTAILTVCSLPSIVQLHVAGMPLALLHLGVRPLTCLWIESGNEVTPQTGIPTWPLTERATGVRDLLFSEQATLDFLLDPHNQVNLEGLQILSVRTSLFQDTRPKLEPLLSICQSSLFQLHLGSQYFQDGFLEDMNCLSNLKVLTVNIDSSIMELRHAGDLFFRLQRVLQTLPPHSLLEIVQLAPWESITFGPGMNTSALKLLDQVLSDEHRLGHFKRLVLGFSTHLAKLKTQDILTLTSLFPRLRDTQRFSAVGLNDRILIRGVADRILNQY